MLHHSKQCPTRNCDLLPTLINVFIIIDKTDTLILALNTDQCYRCIL